MDAPDACVAPFSGSGTPGFTCGRFAGRLGAIFGAPKFTPGFSADGFGATSVNFATVGANFTGAFAVGFAASFAAGFAANFAVDDLTTGFIASGFGTDFGAGFFAVGFFSANFLSVGAEKMREKRLFFSGTGGHELHQICDTTAVAPLIVVPGNNFGEVTT